MHDQNDKLDEMSNDLLKTRLHETAGPLQTRRRQEREKKPGKRNIVSIVVSLIILLSFLIRLLR